MYEMTKTTLSVYPKVYFGHNFIYLSRFFRVNRDCAIKFKTVGGYHEKSSNWKINKCDF